ncbi:MAG: hypothetical protein GC138_03400 [Gammaproteobacteria bacterium]|nr:hypothetical protein [Gammaproteobacteria bacterium]
MLTELMVAMAIGLFLIAGLLAVMTHWLGVDGRLLARSRLNQELGGVLAVMRNEIGRAGFWGRSGNAPDAVNGYRGMLAPTQGCLLYRYDHQGDDPDGVPSPDDMSGFRLKNGVLQYRSRTGACTQDACDGCELGIWSALTDPAFVRIERLDFGLERQTRGEAVFLEVRVNIRGALVHGGEVLDFGATVLAGGA